MKNIWVVLVLVFSFVFVSQINAQDKKTTEEKIDELINSRSRKQPVKEKEIPQLELPEPATPSVFEKEGFSKDEWGRITKTTPLVKHYKDGSVAEKKFSARIGYGNAYKLGARIDGEKYEGFGLNNSPVITIKLGYSLNKYVEIQGDISRATNFENSEKWSSSDSYGPITSEWSNQLIISAYTANLKLTIPVPLTDKVTFSPYIFGGLGRATYKAIYRGEEYYDGIHRKDSETTKFSGNCLKTGVGFDLKVYKNIFLFSEYHYQEMKFMTENRKITIYHSQTVGGVGLRF